MKQITDGQYHWMLNNAREFTFEEKENMSFDDAFEIINRAKSSGAVGNFWKDMHEEYLRRKHEKSI